RKVEGASVPTFSITLVEGAMAPPIGLITFIIDEGAFTIDGNPSAEIFVDYTIDRESSTDYLVTPENVIIYQDYGYDFAFIFEESTNVTGTLDQSKVHIAFDGAALASSDYMSMAEANMLMFQITNAAYIKAGHLKVEIEAGAFMLGKTPSPSISAEWDVVAPRTFNVEVIAKDQDESGKVNDLSEIYILFPEAKTGEVYMASGAQLRSRDYSYSQSAEIRIDETAEKGVKAILSFNPAPEKETEYVLYVHTGAITLDGSFASPEIEKTFIFDKQSGMVALYGDANGNVTVLSIDGKVILLNVPAERIRELENGLYIVNGKKTIVK
ncbi:MAG: hypothetical protein K2H76_05835, partial [Muribaculaceae bacterium]|nr:hypothetical protein [Muribaculaceae bacterium]